MAPSNNPRGSNQYASAPILERLPNLPEIIQGLYNSRRPQKDMPAAILQAHNETVSLRTIQKIVKDYNIQTSRRTQLSDVEMGAAILEVTQEDPLGRWGYRLIQEKLATKGINIPRDFIEKFQKANDPVLTANRHPITRKPHHHALHSSGPNEEWCLDGHEKIFRRMGIAVWGAIDKYSRLELGLYAVPNARLSVVPPPLYLRIVRKYGGLPLTCTGDMGTELGKLIAVQTTLRAIYQPFLPEETLPAHRTVKSVYNITRERAWRPLWEKELGNVAHFYETGKELSEFQENNDLHQGISFWLWGKIVQVCLDEYVSQQQNHHVRYQKKSLLPTGAKRIDMYSNPAKFGGVNHLIEVNLAEIDKLLDKYDLPEYTQFGSDEMVALCAEIYTAIGSPQPRALTGWQIWGEMVQYYNSHY